MASDTASLLVLYDNVFLVTIPPKYGFQDRVPGRYLRYAVGPDSLSKGDKKMATHVTQPFDCQAVSLVVSRQPHHGASLESQRDKQAVL